MPVNSDQLNEILRLRLLEGWSVRRIARHLRMCRRTVDKRLAGKVAPVARRQRASKLDRFKALITELLDADPRASGAVIFQRLQARGYSGGMTILRRWLRRQRPLIKSRRAYVRLEVLPGERFEVDWGHFGALEYDRDKRKLYGFCLVDAHSRRLFVEFTHSQNFETFVRCHLHAFRYMGGVAREIAYDNLATAVIEHDGNLVHFNHRFLSFAAEYAFCPRACHVRAPWEKGKIERAIGYVKKNFWPLRSFSGLADVNSQARQWLAEVANQRLHRETREKPEERLRPEALQPLPGGDADYRESRLAPVHSDLRLVFDANRYCVPARYVGSKLLVKADSQSVTIYDGVKEITSYARCYRKGQTFGAERFEKELLEQRPGARRSAQQQRLIALLGHQVESYLVGLASNDRSLARQITELLELIKLYDPDAVAAAIAKAEQSRAFGSSYVANLLLQQQSPRTLEPLLQLREPTLNQIELEPLSLLEYDLFIFDKGSK